MVFATAAFRNSLLFLLVQAIGSLPLKAEEPAPQRNLNENFEALVKHEYSSQLATFLVLSGLSLDDKALNSAEEAEQLHRELKDSKAPPSPESNRANSLKAARLLHFYLNQLPQDPQKLASSAQWLDSYSKLYADTAKKPLLKAKALYLNALARFYISEGTEGIANLVALRPQLNSDKIMAANIDLFTGYSLVFNPSTASQGLSFLSKAAPTLAVHGRVAQKLIEAQLEAGVDLEGNQLTPAKAQTDAKINAAVQIARTMAPANQNLVMTTAIYIWMKAQGSKESRAPGFLSEGFDGVMAVEALREKEALSLLKAQNFKEASKIYRQLASNLTDLSRAIDQRIWDIEIQSYQKTGLIADLEKSYMTMRERYQSEDRKKAGEVWQEISETYRSSLDQALTQALQAQATAEVKNAALQATLGYLKLESERRLVSPLKVRLALLYKSMNLHKEAVDLYMDLAKEQPLKFYSLAIETQSHLAKWPAQPPFEAPSAGPDEERSKLYGIFEKAAKHKNADEWFFLAHLGLLHRAMHQEKKAEVLWRQAIGKAQSSNKIAMEIGGILLSETYNAKRWQDFIELAHIFSGKKLIPLQKGKNLVYLLWLGDALVHAANADLLVKNHARAAKHLEEFIQAFPSDARLAGATYTLALAYKGLNKLTAALNTCRTIIEKYPQFPQRSKVLLQAGEWAVADKATVEYAIFFYSKFLAEFKSDAQGPPIRLALAELYLKRKHYGWASRLYKEQSLASNVSKEQQVQAAVKYLDIEEKYGEAADALWGAQRIAQLSSPQDPEFLRSIAFQGRYMANTKDLKAMTEIEPKLLSYAPKSKEVLEALGLVRFRRAELVTQTIVNTDNNLVIRDPEATVKKYADRFDTEKLHYAKVCIIGINQMCAPSLWRLSIIAKQSYDAVQKVDIADTLGPTRVNSFRAFKQLHLNRILTMRKDLNQQALKLARQGTTSDIWRDEIIKSIEYDDDAKTAH